MSGNDFENRKDFRRRRKIVIEDDDWTSAGKEFHSMEAATENERRPTVDRRRKAVREAAGLMQIAAGGDLASQRQERVLRVTALDFTEHFALPASIPWKYLISNFPPSAAELFRLPPHRSGTHYQIQSFRHQHCGRSSTNWKLFFISTILYLLAL